MRDLFDFSVAGAFRKEDRVLRFLMRAGFVLSVLVLMAGADVIVLLALARLLLR